MSELDIDWNKLTKDQKEQLRQDIELYGTAQVRVLWDKDKGIIEQTIVSPLETLKQIGEV